MDITDITFEAANRRAATKKAAFPAMVSVRYDRRVARIVIAFDSGLELAFSPKHVQGLENAHSSALVDVEITPSGLGVHFPRLDADLYLPALLESFLGSKRWIAAEMVEVFQPRPKAAVARKNGKLGGRRKLNA